MTPENRILFGPFSLDTANECLWRDDQFIGLTPKTFAILRYLIERPGQLVTKEELLEAVWSDTYVSDAALKVCIRRTREALKDNPKAPQFIETVQRRGYRFIGKVVNSHYSVAGSQKQSGVQRLASSVQDHHFPTPDTRHPTPPLVGREVELAQLQNWLEKALHGERQIIFLAGEAGIGKTAVVDAFIARVAVDSRLWAARGQCVEHYGAGEAYLPILEGVGQLCRQPGRARLLLLLNRYAPTWLAQLPWLVAESEQGKLQQRITSATRERMLREIAEFIEALTAENPLVLVLEDLHWSDYSTLDCLSLLARRREPARLLLIGTYRLEEANEHGHPLQAIKQELYVHRYCQELALGFLSEGDVKRYLTIRFPKSTFPADLARVLHQRTDGNPLFLVNVLDYWLTQGALQQVNGRWTLQGDIESVELGVPESLRQMIKKQIERLSRKDRRILEAASVAGMEFAAATVAAGLAAEVERVEERCEELAQHAHFLQVKGTSEWRDGTVTTRYGFIHELYQNALYERVPAGKRAYLHQRIGERIERGYGNRAYETATELAVHFERGRAYPKAVHYLQQAAKNAIRRCGYREALGHLQKGLELLGAVPDTPERLQQEIALHLSLGRSLIAIKGYAAPEVGAIYTRTLELCRRAGETPEFYWALWGLHGFHLMRAELQTARALGEQLFRLAQRLHDAEFLGVAHYMLGITFSSLGELVLARTHLEQGIALCAPQKPSQLRVACLSFAARVLWGLGYPDKALEMNREALTLSRELSHPFTSVMTFCLAALLHVMRREGHAVQAHAEAAVTMADEQGFADWQAQALILQGWALVEQQRKYEGIVQMRQGVDAYQDTGAELGRPRFLGLLADACDKMERPEEGLAVLAEALAATRKNGQRLQEAWQLWLKGKLLLKHPGARSQKSESAPHSAFHILQLEAEECFHQAIEIARQQSAKSLELRVAMSLSRLWKEQGKKEQARQILVDVYGWFTEGFDTADLQEAKVLLDELS